MPAPLPDTLPATLPASMPPNVRAALREAKARLEELYGERLDRLVLYGSHARGDAREDSDVDLLVVLRGEVNALAEIRRLAGSLHGEMLDRHDVLLSLQPFSEREAADLKRPFIWNVQKEGVEL